ncbi:CIC11C00000001863 [Sungouiella intermedia]|uniref:CIC11C00000001863 n=1 Tax=Sungouiella intermedia TaxID=45354 RepID=A0A1L0D7K4_9ASCO|nr:CIC11C00000001863 [[Candida] intermedia]
MFIKKLITLASLAVFAAAASSDESSSSSRLVLPRTATINGFADPIYDRLPACAKDCVDQPVSFCPYWEPGCLCVTNFANLVAQCYVTSCIGDDIVLAVSLANSVCAWVGVPSPAFKVAASYSTLFDELATAVPSSSVEVIPTDAPTSSEAVSSSPAITSEAESAPESSSPATTADESSSSSSSRLVLPRTATINGFADPIYDRLPECAKECVDQPVSFCPYWEPGCLCVTNFANLVAQCYVESCVGNDIVVAVSLANSVCAWVGVPTPYFRVAASYSTLFDELATAVPSSSAEVTSSAEITSSAEVISSAEVTSSVEVDSSAQASGASSGAESASAGADSSSAAESVYSTSASGVASSDASDAASSGAASEEVSGSVYSTSAYTVGTSSASSNTSKTVVDDLTVVVTDQTTKIVTVCTKCKTLTGPLTTYTTVEKGLTITVTTDCDTDVSYTTYTTVVKGVTTTVTAECDYTTYTTVEGGKTTTVTSAVVKTSGEKHATAEEDVTLYTTLYTTVVGGKTTVVTSTIAGHATSKGASAVATASAAPSAAPAVTTIGENNAGLTSPRSVVMGLALLVAGLAI